MQIGFVMKKHTKTRKGRHRPGGQRQWPLTAAGMLAALLAALLFAGCGMSRPEDREAGFAEKWLEKAQKAKGRSPQIKKRKTLEIQKPFPEQEAAAEKKEKKTLPDVKVSLQLREAPVRSVLRAMAEAADQDLMLNQTVAGTMSVNIQEIPWNDAFQSILDAQGLTWSRQGSVIRVKSMKDLEQELNLTSLQQNVSRQKMAARKFEPLVSRIVAINYGDAEKLAEILGRFLSRDIEGETRGQIAVDKQTNSLVIQATPADTARLKQMIHHLDRPRSQILIEANIVEATQETARELGMRWSGQYMEESGSFLEEFRILDESETTFESFGGTGGLNLSMAAGPLSGNVLYAQLQALEEDGKVNILSSPSITTMDNQMAYTEHGERVPYETTDDEGEPEVEFEDAVLRLEVMPHIIDGKHMRMQIKVKKDQVDFTQTVDGNPLIRAKETETRLVVRDGETIVISGLSKQTVTDTDEGIPVLKDVPLMGWLFKGQEKSEEMEEFLIFITPTILGTRTEQG